MNATLWKVQLAGRGREPAAFRTVRTLSRGEPVKALAARIYPLSVHRKNGG
ncbi:MAG TPA: hypothetical protein VF605_07910 [Allosphingosinicella sp.]|jgi:hypothetical protein